MPLQKLTGRVPVPNGEIDISNLSLGRFEAVLLRCILKANHDLKTLNGLPVQELIGQVTQRVNIPSAGLGAFEALLAYELIRGK